MVRQNNIQIRLTDEERRVLEEIATREDRTLTYVARRGIKREIDKFQVEAKKRGRS